jgi:hypothetical protein
VQQRRGPRAARLRPLNQFAVINTSKTLSTVDLLFMVEACDQQVDEFSEAWGLDPVACVVLYGDVSKLPVDDVMIAWVCDSLDEPDALGYHSAIGDRPFIKVLAQGPQTSITLSHEFLETLGDPTCDRWARVGDGTEIAVEVRPSSRAQRTCSARWARWTPVASPWPTSTDTVSGARKRARPRRPATAKWFGWARCCAGRLTGS